MEEEPSSEFAGKSPIKEPEMDQHSGFRPESHEQVSHQDQQNMQNHKPTNSSGVIALQWLTYTLWGLVLIAVSTLSSSVITFFMVKESDHTGLDNVALYSGAAVLVLLPLAIACELFYLKREPQKKVGAAAVLSVIYSIIFALVGVCALISAVFSLVSIIANDAEVNVSLAVCFSSVIIAILSALVFLRTLMPSPLFRFRKYFLIIMSAVIGVIFVLGIFGPVADLYQTRNDRLIENNLYSVSYAIRNYEVDNGKLPDSLATLSLDGDAKKLIDNNLVSYQKSSETDYQLCVTYQKAKGTSSSSSYSSSYSPDTYSHPAGRKCYSLSTEYSSHIEPMPIEDI
jgi:hypothetical protein